VVASMFGARGRTVCTELGCLRTTEIGKLGRGLTVSRVTVQSGLPLLQHSSTILAAGRDLAKLVRQPFRLR